ncbi:MAG: hypothetical protein OEZ58_06855 [Gammaproteobacteria bacterium]|nr:hypothetical protein [Gammaproteobacteria bacterium]
MGNLVSWKHSVIAALILSAALGIVSLIDLKTVSADGWDTSSQAEAIDSIVKSRHNLTMSYTSFQAQMNDLRNNYYEVCVYCHTPHGANSTVAAPLWNRTVINRTYQVFGSGSVSGAANSLSGESVGQPGPNSLTCLSCHDGATAIDSIINMPTQMSSTHRAGYSVLQETSENDSFLDAWADNQLGMTTGNHSAFNDTGTGGGLNEGTTSNGECFSCHNGGTTAIGPDFGVFVIGGKYGHSAGADAQTPPVSGTDNLQKIYNDLTDDHPIGVKYPSDFSAARIDYNEPDVVKGRIAFFDTNGNRHADPSEVRLYDTGDGLEVECGSCHDPHGVKQNNVATGELIPSFLRVGQRDPSQSNVLTGNTASSLCLTCHVK